jgi:putative glutamine amidotransferase
MEMPFLGICRGFQILNVALGGTLHTHIEDQLPGAVQHACFTTHPIDHEAHSINLKPGSLLAEIHQAEQVMVNSHHHQGAKDIAGNLEEIGWAPDGLVEAVSLPEHPFGLGVQWYPEWMPKAIQQQRLFAALIRAATKYRKNRGNQ